jgi:cyclopropane-fatty-acyl-phospholipid synthase
MLDTASPPSAELHDLPTQGAAALPRPGMIQRLCRAAVLARLARLAGGAITFIDCDGQEYGCGSPDAGLRVTIQVAAPEFWVEVACRGTIGAAESYMAGEWRVDDLTTLVRLLALDLPVADRLERGLARLSAPAFKILHLIRRNTRSGSRRNISAHYDLGNEFFSLFLDPTMMYSCAYFARPQATLEEAATAKLERICQQLDLKPTDRVIEIGSGWGGFAIHAASRYGCHVTTTTISRAQYDLAVERVRSAGLTGQIEVLLKDYRDLTGSYDKLVSIEMIEAVGKDYLDTFLRSCSHLLHEDGVMLLQCITMADQRYVQACSTVDFIQRYIFPGSFLPSVTAIASSLTAATNLRLVALDDITPHYALTLAHWRKRFLARLDRVRALGYSEQFIRMWDFYLCYCAGGFHERCIGTVQMLIGKPGYRQAAEHALNRPRNTAAQLT